MAIASAVNDTRLYLYIFICGRQARRKRRKNAMFPKQMLNQRGAAAEGFVIMACNHFFSGAHILQCRLSSFLSGLMKETELAYSLYLQHMSGQRISIKIVYVVET